MFKSILSTSTMLSRSMQKIKKLILAMSLMLFNIHTFSAEKILQSIDNIEEYRAHEGNNFQLIQTNHGCRIDAHFYLSNQNHLYHYFFNHNNQQLRKATVQIFKYHYQKGKEGSLLHVTDTYQDSNTVLNLDDPQVQQDFKNYKALFSTNALSQCK